MKYEREILALMQKAERSLKVSRDLIESENYDFALSRAYYAMYYAATALLLTKDMKFSKHSAVIASFGREFVKSGLLSEDLYGYLIKGFRERQKGDYEIMIIPSRGDALAMAEKAGIFLEAASVYLKGEGYYLPDLPGQENSSHQ
jgi:uncharacterized protein (UPF0332 family)